MIDLLSLNGCVSLTKFKMEMVSLVLGSIRNGDFMFLIDLKDAYFQIAIHPDFQPYLGIVLISKPYQFKALCFSLFTAPQVFTKVFGLTRGGYSSYADWTNG